jgi:phosphoribosylanthranilate isomerase
MVQLHGGEGPAFCREAARRTGCKVIKALPVRSTADVRRAEAFRTDFHLLDAHRPGQVGGTGESFDWELLSGRRSEVPLILAGGLTPDNVADAVRVAKPFAVDVASGVEAGPGVKDHGLMAEFIERAQAVAAPAGGELTAGADLQPRR